MANKMCVSPWGELYLEPDGTMRTCCVASEDLGNINEKNWKDIWNEEKLKDIRKKLLNNQWPKNCEICRKQEESGHQSFRYYINQEFILNHLYVNETTREDGTDTEEKLSFLDIRWSNLCNFSCIMCGSNYSSKWAEIEKKFNISDKPSIRNETEKNIDVYQLPIDNLEKIYLAGGEPLIHPKTYELLDRMIEENKTDINIMINTNMSTLKYKERDVIDLLKKFNHVYFLMSIDGYGERAEYIRQGTNWEQVEKNIFYVSELSKNNENFDAVFSYTLTLWNALHLKDFIRWAQKNVDKEIVKHSVLNISQSPWYFNAVYLPNELRNKIISDYNEILKELESGSLFQFIENEIKRQKNTYINDDDWNEFLSYFNNRKDYYRKIFSAKPEDVLPELEMLFKQAKEYAEVNDVT